MMMRTGLLAAVSLIATGCVSIRPVDLAKPSELTVQRALADVAEGLVRMRQLGRENNTVFGLIVDDVTVTLKVTASAGDSNKLVVDAANIQPAVLAGGNLGIKIDNTAESTGNRDNTIEIKMRNVYTADLNELGKKAKVVTTPCGTTLGGGAAVFSLPENSNCDTPGPTVFDSEFEPVR